MRAALALALALAAVVVPAAAEAQGTPERLELSGYVGGMSFTQDLGSASNIYLTVSGSSDKVPFGKLYGFRASWAFTRNLAAEFSATRASHAYSLSVDDAEAGTAALPDQFDARELFLSGSLLVKFPLRIGLVPYGSVGVGQLATRPESAIEGIDKVNATDVTFGGGVKYWIPAVRWLGVVFDVRYHTATKGLSFPRSEGKPSGAELTVGGTVRLF